MESDIWKVQVFPIGGENTHSVLTGHRGLPSSKLLVRLDEMKIGDLFFIHTYKEVMAYKVEDIMVVKPEGYCMDGDKR